MMRNESDEDNWQPLPSTSSMSMFSKIQVKFTDQQIDSQEEQMLSTPHYFNDEDIEPEERPQQPQKSECLYDPLEDDENESWVQQAHKEPKSKPLTCPSCFTPLAFSYKSLPNGQHLCPKPSSIEVLETKVIRNRECPQKMDLSLGEDQDKIFASREEEFNVKILCICQCGADVGYYDVNKAAYVLVNVV